MRRRGRRSGGGDGQAGDGFVARSHREVMETSALSPAAVVAMAVAMAMAVVVIAAMVMVARVAFSTHCMCTGNTRQQR